MLTEIIFSGFGGQGILFAGKSVAYSAMNCNNEISWLPSYGPEMRGGTANCSVCLSDEPIGSPLVTNPDILVIMNTPSFDRFEECVKPNGKIFIDSSMTSRKSNRKDIECYYIPATEIAEKSGLVGMANIVLLGKMLKECKNTLLGIGLDEVKQGLNILVSQKRKELLEKNIKALDLGAWYC